MKHKKFILSSLISGILPHTFCILFIILSILGATSASLYLRPFFNTNFFYFLILLSFVFTTLSAIFYLHQNGILSWSGIKRKWQYLSLMFSLTLTINLFLFFVVFPLVAKNPAKGQTAAYQVGITKQITLAVQIPCTGHVPLIKAELQKINGISLIYFQSPNLFIVDYNPQILTEEQILASDLFKEFPVKRVK